MKLVKGRLETKTGKTSLPRLRRVVHIVLDFGGVVVRASTSESTVGGSILATAEYGLVRKESVARILAGAPRFPPSGKVERVG